MQAGPICSACRVGPPPLLARRCHAEPGIVGHSAAREWRFSFAFHFPFWHQVHGPLKGPVKGQKASPLDAGRGWGAAPPTPTAGGRLCWNAGNTKEPGGVACCVAFALGPRGASERVLVSEALLSFLMISEISRASLVLYQTAQPRG